jgi:hypothetical protein
MSAQFCAADELTAATSPQPFTTKYRMTLAAFGGEVEVCLGCGALRLTAAKKRCATYASCASATGRSVLQERLLHFSSPAEHLSKSLWLANSRIAL